MSARVPVFKTVAVGDVVELYPEPTHEGPHPDDEFAHIPRCRVCGITQWATGDVRAIELLDQQTGETLTLSDRSASSGDRPLGSIRRIITTAAAAGAVVTTLDRFEQELRESGMDECALGEALDYMEAELDRLGQA